MLYRLLPTNDKIDNLLILCSLMALTLFVCHQRNKFYNNIFDFWDDSSLKYDILEAAKGSDYYSDKLCSFAVTLLNFAGWFDTEVPLIHI